MQIVVIRNEAKKRVANLQINDNGEPERLEIRNITNESIGVEYLLEQIKNGVKVS